MNEVLDVISRRFSCRYYTGEEVTKDQMKIIAEAGAKAPSAHNRKPWRIIAVSNGELMTDMEEEVLKELKSREDQRNYSYVMKKGGHIFYGAPGVILVVTDESQSNSQLDGGIAGQNMVLAATSLGLGTVYCGFLRQAFSKERAEEFRRRLGIPEGFEFCCAVVVGHPAKTREQLPGGFDHISYID